MKLTSGHAGDGKTCDIADWRPLLSKNESDNLEKYIPMCLVEKVWESNVYRLVGKDCSTQIANSAYYTLNLETPEPFEPMI